MAIKFAFKRFGTISGKSGNPYKKEEEEEKKENYNYIIETFLTLIVTENFVP